MHKQTEWTPAQRAARYLERIAVLTGAQPVYGDDYVLTSGRRHFLVRHKSVRVISRSGKSTCFSITAVPDMPRAELIASALLQLKNNPKLFKKWRKQQGYLFKANGKMFRGTFFGDFGSSAVSLPLALDREPPRKKVRTK